MRTCRSAPIRERARRARRPWTTFRSRQRSRNSSTNTSSGRRRRRSRFPLPFTTIISAFITTSSPMWNCRSPTFCSSVPPAAAKRSLRRRSRACWMCRSPLPTPPRSPRRAMSAKMWRTFFSAFCRRRILMWNAPSAASSISTSWTRYPAKARTFRSRVMSPARVCSRRC